MKRAMFISAVSVVLMCVCSVQAGVTIFDTNFDGSTPSVDGPDLTGVTWGQDASMAGVVNVSDTVTSVGGYELSQTPPAGGPAQWEDNVSVAHNLNADRSTPRGFAASFSVAADADSIELGQIVVGHTHTTNIGWLQAYISDMTVTLNNVTDGVEMFTDTTTYDYTDKAWQNHSYDLSSLVLEAGKDYSLTVTMQDMVGGGAFATWNQVSMTTVPEPATMCLLGLGSLIIARRRKN